MQSVRHQTGMRSLMEHAVAVVEEQDGVIDDLRRQLADLQAQQLTAGTDRGVEQALLLEEARSKNSRQKAGLERCNVSRDVMDAAVALLTQPVVPLEERLQEMREKMHIDSEIVDCNHDQSVIGDLRVQLTASADREADQARLIEELRAEVAHYKAEVGKYLLVPREFKERLDATIEMACESIREAQVKLST